MGKTVASTRIAAEPLSAPTEAGAPTTGEPVTVSADPALAEAVVEAPVEPQEWVSRPWWPVLQRPRVAVGVTVEAPQELALKVSVAVAEARINTPRDGWVRASQFLKLRQQTADPASWLIPNDLGTRGQRNTYR